MPDLNTYLARFLYGRLPQLASGGPSGVLTVSTATAGTAANTDETDLWTYTLPANTLGVDGYGLRITLRVFYAANANVKTVKLYAGSDVLPVNPTTTAPNGLYQSFQALYIRTGAATQTLFPVISVVGSGAQTHSNQIAATSDLTAAVVLKVTGQNGAASADDISLRTVLVELL